MAQSGNIFTFGTPQTHRLGFPGNHWTPWKERAGLSPEGAPAVAGPENFGGRRAKSPLLLAPYFFLPLIQDSSSVSEASLFSPSSSHNHQLSLINSFFLSFSVIVLPCEAT
jgi:hypothetical protein